MRILLLNWRDIKNPQSGGAEILTHEMAKRWVAWGHPVTVFTSRFPGGRHEEEVDGVRILRRGAWWTVHAYAFFYYVLHGNSYDVIVDEVHWFPFFSALYARKKTVLLACEVARDLFPALYPFPLSWFWRAIERLYFFFYRRVPTLAISRSTKEDLVVEGLDAERITVIPMGVTAPSRLPRATKEKDPTFIYLSRINEQKGTEDALKAFQLIRKRLPKSVLWMVGKGEAQYEKNMKQLVDALGITHAVRFFGRVSDSEKFRLLSRAHLLVFPSMHEGWGLVVNEAGLVGTPTIAYNVSGLKDVVLNGRTGVLVDPSPEALAAAAVNVFRHPVMYQKLQKEAAEHARTCTWDRTAREALRVLQSV